MIRGFEYCIYFIIQHSYVCWFNNLIFISVMPLSWGFTDYLCTCRLKQALVLVVNKYPFFKFVYF